VRRLGAALSGVESAAQLTRHLLAFARRQPLMPDTVDPARLLHGLEDLLRQRLGERISVEVVVHSAIWALRADPQLLEDSILHLARNAREAMPRGGRLTLAASNVLIDEAAAAEQAEIKPGEYVLISVSDTGCGMASEVQARATEPFFTTKPDHPGSGLGLPIVLGFARQSEGNVTIESTLGRGTTVRLYLPRRRTLADPPPASPAPTPAQAPAAARGELVLAVEDDEAVRLAVVQALGSLGYQVMEASDAASALELMRNGARPDILFTDFVMPGEVGALDLAREARRLHPGIAVLLTSGYVDSANTLADAEDVPFALLSKPWRIGDLGRELRAALQAAGAAAANAAAPPAATPPALPATLPATPLATPAAERRPRRAMVVEDDAMVRMITAELLADLGYSVIEHSTGGAALQALNATGSDLLVTDVGLPDMSGLEMARRAVEITPSLAVVIASGDHHERDDGFTYLEKPYDAYRLRQAVTHARATGA
jgi:CheY-like chemotaxis protein